MWISCETAGKLNYLIETTTAVGRVMQFSFRKSTLISYTNRVCLAIDTMSALGRKCNYHGSRSSVHSVIYFTICSHCVLYLCVSFMH